MNDRIDAKLTKKIDHFFDLTPTDPGFTITDIIKSSLCYAGEFFGGLAVSVALFFGIELL